MGEGGLVAVLVGGGESIGQSILVLSTQDPHVHTEIRFPPFYGAIVGYA